jgi:hypothetical protein
MPFASEGVGMRKGVALVVASLVALVSGCSSSNGTLINHPSGSSGVAHVGDTLDLTTLSGKHFAATLTQVIDPATGKKVSAGSGKRFVATVFRITNSSGSSLQQNLGADVLVFDSSGNQYVHFHADLSDCSGATAAQLTVGVGQSATACAAFKLRNSVKVAKVQFIPTAGAANDYGEWIVP